MEAFKMRVEIPVVYTIFYNYFLKPSVGDARWKKICMDERSGSLGNVKSESFVMILLKKKIYKRKLNSSTRDPDKWITELALIHQQLKLLKVIIEDNNFVI